MRQVRSGPSAGLVIFSSIALCVPGCRSSPEPRPAESGEAVVDALLVATGRVPNVEGLGLEEAGVTYDRRLGVPCSDFSIDVVSVVRAVGGERGDGAVDQVEQGSDPRAVIDILAGHVRPVEGDRFVCHHLWNTQECASRSAIARVAGAGMPSGEVNRARRFTAGCLRTRPSACSNPSSTRPSERCTRRYRLSKCN